MLRYSAIVGFAVAAVGAGLADATRAAAPRTTDAARLATLPADQSALIPVINAGERLLRFDWPAIRIGTGEYEEGPTGVTVFQFARRASGAVDVRGGSPGTVNTDYLRQGYDRPLIDAVVFAGGSAYGNEAVAAVATAMKDDGLRGGRWDNVAFAAGANIYDFGDRRLNEVYPDKRLAQAAYHAARPGVFPLGAQGAGRFAEHGGLFGCNVYSGQGGAFRQLGDLKIAAFVVVNAVGIVTGRDGRVAACYRDPAWPSDLRTTDLLARYPALRRGGWPDPGTEPRGNTTLSLVVTNRQLNPAQLQRLAAQVHTSMGRAIQPFATEFDGDVLYAVSTGELATPATPLDALDLNVLASEVMWDAILASIPEQPSVASATATGTAAGVEDLRRYVGDYVVSPLACLRVVLDGARLTAVAAGERPLYAIGPTTPVELKPRASGEFVVAGRYPLSLRFDGMGTVLINPGHWQQRGERRSGCPSTASENRR